MLFCPCCGNLLLIQHHTQGEQSFFCQTCPYVFPIGSKEVKTAHLIVFIEHELCSILKNTYSFFLV